MMCVCVCVSVHNVCRERMKLPYMADQCEQMLKISNEFVRLQVSNDEYLCMKVLLLLSTGEHQDFVCVCEAPCFADHLICLH